MSESPIKEIHIADFDYPLPDARIARHPLAERDACKLLLSKGEESAGISHHIFSELPALLPEDCLLVCNETRVINARIKFERSTGAKIETFLLEPVIPADFAQAFAQTHSTTWKCMVGNAKKWKENPLLRKVDLSENSENSEKSIVLKAFLEDDPNAAQARNVRFEWDDPSVTFADIVEAAGNIPIPPYLKRESEKSDLTDYQTVYSRVKGSVAAPTAGLHFTPDLFKKIESRGIKVDKVTLHVGAGTFQPVKSETIGAHPMHTETIRVPLVVIRAIADTLAQGRKVVAVGTTSVRTLESLPYFALLAEEGMDPADPKAMHVGQWIAYSLSETQKEKLKDIPSLLRGLADELERRGAEELAASTAIMIAPGFEWRIVAGMVTNFHQPQSTLLLLVSSFLGPEREWRKIYNEALEKDYRFLSYGDACLFLK